MKNKNNIFYVIFFFLQIYIAIENKTFFYKEAYKFKIKILLN
jgi:hypothetical protein